MTLQYRKIDNAKVQAYLPPIVQYPDGFRGGPVLLDEADALLRHTRGRKPVDSFRDEAAYNARLAGEYSYAGPIYGHFGHFMAEMVHRILPIKQRKLECPFVFVTSQDWTPHPTYEHFPDFCKEILSFLEVQGNQVRVIGQNTIVETLHIVEAGSDLSGGAKPGYSELLRDYSRDRLDKIHGRTRRPNKIYVSRSALEPQGFILGETYFESQLEREGYTIFRPEEFRVTPQMDYYRKADIAIFPEGSACHGTELLGEGMMSQTFVLPRRDGWSATKFGEVLAPRSKSTEVMNGCVTYLGTASAHPRVGTPLYHIGASWLEVDQVVAFFRQRSLAKLPDISVRAYAEAAEEDFNRYLAFQARPGAAWNDVYACEVMETFRKKIEQVS
jgi:hypothetical protein